MWWIALSLPQLPLEALPQAPQVVLDGRRIGWLDASAMEAGIQPGMSLATALARCSGLRAQLRDAPQEAHLLRRMALALLRYTPALSLLHDGLLLEVQSSLRLFGGPLRLWKRIQDDTRSFNVSAHFAAAPYPEAAYLLARVRGPLVTQGGVTPGLKSQPPLGVGRSRDASAVRHALDALPLRPVLQAWASTAQQADLLTGLGVSTLGELRALPRSGLERRVGPELPLLLDKAYGQVPDPRPVFVPPAAFDERLELPERSQDLDLILQALEHLLRALAGWLIARRRCAQEVVLYLVHETRRHHGQPDTELTLRLASPAREVQPLMLLWKERLSRTPLTAPVASVRLELRLHQPEVPGTLPLPLDIPAAHVDRPHQALAALLDRLQARLGPEAVQFLQPLDDHRPERASRLVEVQAVGSAAAPAPSDARASVVVPEGASSGGSGRLPRPCWLLTEPEPLAEKAGVPLYAGSALVLRTRAERIEAGWFDDDFVSRDYHVAEAADHRLCWVFRQRIGDSAAWYLHGWFA